MKKVLKKWLVSLIFISLIIGQAGSQAEGSAGEANVLRIENEAKLVVPLEKLEEVWSYLEERLVEDKDFIKSLDPKLESYWQKEYFEDIYYDTPDLKLLEKKSSVRHRKRTSDNPTDKKSGRELIQIKLSGIDSNQFNRGEIKFDVKYHRKIKSVDDGQPVIGVIKRDEREDFKQRLVGIGVDPYALKKILVIEQERRSIYITKKGEPFISIRLDEDFSEDYWARWNHGEIEPELNEIHYTEGGAEERKYMEEINKKIIEDILKKFPEIKMDLTPKYNKAFDYFESRIPFLRTMIKNFSWG